MNYSVPCVVPTVQPTHTAPSLINAFRPARLMKERWLAAASTTHPSLQLIMCLCRVNLHYNALLLYVNDACSVHVLCVRVHEHLSGASSTCTCPVFHLYNFAWPCHCLSCAHTKKTRTDTHARTLHMYTESRCCVGFLFQEIPLSKRQEFKGAPSWHASWDNERLCLGLDCWLRIFLQDKQATVQPRGHTWSTAQSNRQSQSSWHRPSCCLLFFSDGN